MNKEFSTHINNNIGGTATLCGPVTPATTFNSPIHVAPLPPSLGGGVFSLQVFRNNYEASKAYWLKAKELKVQQHHADLQMFKRLNNYNPINRRKTIFNDKAKDKEFYKNYNKNADRNGGFIHLNKLHEIARQTKYSYNTIRIKLNALTRLGLAERKKTGWVLVSTKRASASLGVALNSLKIKGSNKEEILNNLTLRVISEMVKRQGHATHNANGKVTGNISCQFIATHTGYKSAMTGWRREKKLQAAHKLQISNEAKAENEKRPKPRRVYFQDNVEGQMLFQIKCPCNVLTVTKTAKK